MARRPVLLLAVTLALGGCTGGARARPQRPEPPAFTPPAEATSVAVPDVRGMAMDAARAALESAGFLVGLIEPWPDSLGYAAGTVVAQRPGRATPAPPGAAVDLRVYGISDEEARHAMEASRPLPVDPPPVRPLPPAPPPATPDPALPPVPPPTPPPARPPPAPAPGGRGGLESTAVVPNLVGLPFAEAARVARDAGFDVVPLRVAGGTPGHVVSQDVEPGREAPVGSPIGIRVGK